MKTLCLMKSLCSILLFSSIVFSQEIYKPDIRKGEIKIDGKLEEPDWRDAKVYSGFNLLKSMSSEKPKVDTSFRILRDEEAIYIGIRCEEPYMNKLREEFLPRDPVSWERDSIEIFVDPEGRGINYYQLAVTVSNVQWDGYFIEGGNTQGGYYSSVWESAVYKGGNYWSVEVKIPLYCFYYTDSKDFSNTWLLNITRERFPEWELSTWAPLDARFHEPKKFRKFSNMPVKSPVYDLRIAMIETDIKDESLKGDLIIKLKGGKKTAGQGEVKVYEGDKEIGSKKVNLKEGENPVRIEGIEFGKKGKKELKVLVLKERGTILGAIQELNVDYEKLKVEIDKPFYSNCIYPGQKIENIEGRIHINVPEDKIKGSRVYLEFRGDNFEKKMEIEGKKETLFKIKADGLKEGDYNLIVEVKGKQGIIDRKEVKIRKLPKPEKCSYVYIDEDLNLL